jgi:hypothetical protein
MITPIHLADVGFAAASFLGTSPISKVLLFRFYKEEVLLPQANRLRGTSIFASILWG